MEKKHTTSVRVLMAECLLLTSWLGLWGPHAVDEVSHLLRSRWEPECPTDHAVFMGTDRPMSGPRS